MTLRRQFLIGASATLLSSPLLAQTVIVQQTNVVDALAAAGNYDSFLELVSRAGAVDTLRGAGPFTLLAPNNVAMARMPDALREMLVPSTGGASSGGSSSGSVDIVRLGAFVNMHIIQGRSPMNDMMGRVTQVRTRNGNTVEFNGMQGNAIQAKIVGDSGFGVGGATIRLVPVTLSGNEIQCSNGVVLPISEPLIQ